MTPSVRLRTDMTNFPSGLELTEHVSHMGSGPFWAPGRRTCCTDGSPQQGARR